MPSDRRAGVLVVGGSLGQQRPVRRQGPVHFVYLEPLEMIGVSDGFHLVGFRALVAEDAEAADLEGLDHDVLAQVRVPLDGRGAEHVAFVIGIDLFARSFPGPGASFLVHDPQILRIGDIIDFQRAADVLVHVPAAVEIDDVLPGMEGFDGDRVVGLDGHVFRVLVRIPVVQLAFKRLGFMLMGRGRRVDEAAGFRIHAVAGGIGFWRRTVLGQRVGTEHVFVCDGEWRLRFTI